MVEKIIISPNEVRAYGNIVDNKEIEDYEEYKSYISTGEDFVNGVLSPVTMMAYSVYNVGLHFNAATKVLYVEDDSDLVDSFDFEDKCLALESDNVEFGFDDNALYLDSEIVVHDYSLSFDSSSYTATGGAVTVSATLLDDGVAVSGATVSFSGTGVSTSATTDGSGVAEVTLTGLTDTITLTASYSNVSDTCTITVLSYLFYDDCSSSRVTEYTTKGNQTITYDSNGYYEIKVTSQSCPNVKINSVTVPNRVKISMDMKMVTSGSNSQPKIYLFDESKNKGYGLRITQNNSKWNLQTYTSYTDCGNNLIETTIDTSLNTWYHMELIVDGNDLTGNLYNSSNTLLGTITSTGSLNLSSTGNYVAIGCNYTTNAIIQVKNIKVEAL